MQPARLLQSTGFITSRKDSFNFNADNLVYNLYVILFHYPNVSDNKAVAAKNILVAYKLKFLITVVIIGNKQIITVK